jgi:flagellar protein FliL
MLRKLLPLLLAVAATAGGAAGGYVLRPAAPMDGEHASGEGAADAPEAARTAGVEDQAGAGADTAEDQGEAGDLHAGDGAEHDDPSDVPDYVKLNNQFVIPVVEDGRVSAMVILSLSLEVDAGQAEAVYAREPKLRDAFLQVMFDHANMGGFRGTFTDGSNLIVLRQTLHETAVKTLGPMVRDVLIGDIARQDA